MSSPRRIESSRNNGARSQGPNTPEGKSRSAQNAFTHGLTSGLTAKTVVLSNESAPAFENMLARYITHFEPTNPLQADLIEELAVAKWRQRRLWLIETAALDFEMDRQENEVAKIYNKIDEPTRLALAFKALADSSSLLSNLSRYESRHRRAYENAHKRLEASRAQAQSLDLEQPLAA